MSVHRPSLQIRNSRRGGFETRESNLRGWPLLLPILLFAITSSIGTTPASAFDVVSHSPSKYELAVDQSLTTITFEFDEAPSLNGNPVRVAGVMSGLHAGTASVNGNTLTYTLDGKAFQWGEQVKVNLHRDIEGAGSTDPLTGGFFLSFTIESYQGTGTFDDGTIYQASSIPYFIHGGDLDNDGTPDIAVPNEGTNDVSVYLNSFGDGDFAVRDEYGVGNKPSSIFGEDFDNDGDTDLATADIVSGTMSTLENNGDGSYQARTEYAAGDVCRQVHGADFDGDLDVDLCTTSRGTDQVYIFTNDGSGTFFGSAYGSGIPDGPFTINADDYNLDGHCDIAVGCQNVDQMVIMFNDGTGGFTTSPTYATGDGPWDMVANDFDADGDPDLLVALSFGNRIAVLRNNGNGEFFSAEVQGTDSFPLACHAADLDGDGDIDAIASCFSGGTSIIYTNNGSGDLTRDRTFNMTQTGSYAWASDLDGDRDLDLTVVDENADLLFVFYQENVPTKEPGGDPIYTGPRLTVQQNPMRIAEGTTILLEHVSEQFELQIVSVDGRTLRTINTADRIDSKMAIRWDGKDATGREVTPGRYFLKMKGISGLALRGEIVAIQ